MNWLKIAMILLASSWLVNAARADFSYALLVGGGPNENYNQAGIELHLRFVDGILPALSFKKVLFANGDRKSKTIEFFDDSSDVTTGEQILSALFPDDLNWPEPKLRAPELPGVFSASTRDSLKMAVSGLREKMLHKSGRVLMYFTGHGEKNDANNDDNFYDLWGDGKLSVRDLTQELKRLPASSPIVLVMVQCYSGAFGNLLFANGEPRDGLRQRDFAGFFSTTKDRMAEGCTADLNEADYQDFSSYFFGALCGHNRLGMAVSGADFNGDGKVGMNEAFCYAILHENGTDVPVCTSDILLRRLVKMKNREIFSMPYSKLLAAADPAQRAVLEGLSQQLGLNGEDRLLTAYDWFQFLPESVNATAHHASAAAQLRFDEVSASCLQEVLRRWPMLRWNSSKQFDEVAEKAAQTLSGESDDPRWQELLEANFALNEAQRANDIANAKLMRFLRMSATVVLQQELLAHGSAAEKRAFLHLRALEAQPF